MNISTPSNRAVRIRGFDSDPSKEVVGVVTGLHVDVGTGDLLMEVDLETPAQAAERITRGATSGGGDS